MLGRAPAGARVQPALEVSGDLGAVLDELGRRGVLQLLVEGGADVAHEFHRDGLVDRYVWYLAPVFLGGDDGRPVFAGPGAATMADAWRGRLVSVRRLGGDCGSISNQTPRLDVDVRSSGSSGAGRLNGDKEAVTDVPMASIEDAIAAIGRGEMVVVVDDEDRENEGDLVMAAEFATPEKVAFFLAHTSGLICVPLTPERLDELELPLMVSHNTESQRTAFTVTVDYRHGTTTGISAGDRAATIQALISPETKPADLARPGHILPLRYRPGGVLKRAGHTEATVDLARMAGCYPAGLLCEIVTEDKQPMARQPELERFAADHGLLVISIADLVRYRRRREKLVERVAAARIPTAYGEFTAYGFQSLLDGEQHLAFVAGDVSAHESVLVRVHSECLTGDVFGSLRCDCGPQLDAAIRTDRRRKAPGSSSTSAATRDAASVSPTSCAPTTCRTTAGTPSTPTSSSACPSTAASTASAPRSSSSSASRRCAS